MPLIAWVVTRQRVSGPTWAGAGLGFAGVVLVLQPPQGQSFDIGEMSALAGALFLAVAMMSVRWLGATEPPLLRVLFYYFLLSTVMSVPIAVFDWQPFPPAEAWGGWLIGLGFAQLFSQILIVVAYRYASAEKVGAVHLLGHRVHRADRLARLGSPAHAGHLPRHGAGHRRWPRGRPRQTRHRRRGDARTRTGQRGGNQMSHWLVSNVPSGLLLLGLIVVIAGGGAVLIQAFLRHRFPRLRGGDAHNDVTKFAFGVVAFVYAFFIGFVVSAMWGGQINSADGKVRAEGSAAVQMAKNLTVFDAPDRDRLRNSLLEYEQAALTEWPLAAKGHSYPEADSAWTASSPPTRR